ncbi:hypothetical protein K438DRAFT_2024981 [Mycena galopus ATCC 62051]|nr:hypothetical protein K438DRAFT_2024981 [Mycena galopus ATCC 62051]
MEHHPNTERPCGGSYWLLLAMPVTVLWFWLWIWLVWILDGPMVRIGVIVWCWFWLEVMLVGRSIGWIRWRGWKKKRWKDILVYIITLGGALVALSHLFHQTPYLSAVMAHWSSSTPLNWIAAHIYFVWSPEFMRIGLVVFVVGRWISAFTHAHQARASATTRQTVYRDGHRAALRPGHLRLSTSILEAFATGF